MNFPHPIRLIGRGIYMFESIFLGPKDIKSQLSGTEEMDPSANNSAKNLAKRQLLSGIFMCASMILITLVVTATIIVAGYLIHPIAGIAAEAVLTCYILAAKSLKTESLKVYDALKNGTLEDARHAVSMIVGRDTASLDEAGVARATVETVAENTSDGVIAPLIYTFIGGPALGMVYKTINTMDSMVGYHNERFEYFGKAAAKLDDVVNFIPARLSALFMIMAAFAGGRDFSGKGALKIFLRDRFKHKSPNSAQTESVCAGALSLRLAGDASYFGKIVKKPFIGDPIREIEAEDIKRSCRLMYYTEDIALVIIILIVIMI